MGSSTQMTRSQFHSGSSPSQWFFYSILLDGVNISALSLEDFYMREFWVQIGTSPIVYRYIDWSITVPLQMVEFYLILSAVQPDISPAMFWRLMLGTVAVLAFAHCDGSGSINAGMDFAFGNYG